MPAIWDWKSQIENLYKTGGAQTNAANPDDPSQVAKWGLGLAEKAAATPLLSADSIKQMQTLLAPYFQKARENVLGTMSGAINSQLGNATRQATAGAAYRGYNPASYVQSARSNVTQNMTPSFFHALGQMDENQLSQLLNMTSQSNQFSVGNQGKYSGQMMDWAKVLYAIQNQPSFLESILGGAVEGGAKIGAAKLFGA